ncbi:TPA: ead/Ea22-like family protein [Serratia marcescens]|nr:ead/Ea22-like family protein [Serratia marcescens]
MDKFSELKAAAMAATPGPWISGDDSWSDGDHANISTADRYDSGIINIAQVDGGGSESGFDEPFSSEQQANARYITAANPAVVLELLAELEAKDKRIIGLERHVKDIEATLIAATDEVADLTKERDEARAKLATPVRLLGEMLVHDWDRRVERQAAFEHRKIAWDARLEEDKKAILAAGFTFTVEGDE